MQQQVLIKSSLGDQVKAQWNNMYKPKESNISMNIKLDHLPNCKNNNLTAKCNSRD
jgi:hypothetical protein